MEPRFILTRALETWQDRLRHSGTLSPDDVEELTAHLADSMADLRAAGLSEEKAFMISTKRLGKPETVSQEFEKLDGPKAIPRETVMLLFGALGLVLLRNTLVLLLDQGFWTIMTTSGIGPRFDDYFFLLTQSLLVVLAVALFWLARPAQRWQARLFEWLHRWPIAVVAGLGALLVWSGYYSLFGESDIDSITVPDPRNLYGETIDLYYAFWVEFYLLIGVVFLTTVIRHTAPGNPSPLAYLRKAPLGWLLAGGTGLFLLIFGTCIAAVKTIAPEEGMWRFPVSIGLASLLIGWVLARSPRYGIVYQLCIALTPAAVWGAVSLGSFLLGDGPTHLSSPSFLLSFFGSALAGALFGRLLAPLFQAKSTAQA